MAQLGNNNSNYDIWKQVKESYLTAAEFSIYLPILSFYTIFHRTYMWIFIVLSKQNVCLLTWTIWPILNAHVNWR